MPIIGIQAVNSKSLFSSDNDLDNARIEGGEEDEVHEILDDDDEYSDGGPDLMQQFSGESGAAVRVGILEDLLNEIRDIFFIICNTIMTAIIVVEMSQRPHPVIWILHEWWWDDEMIKENLRIRNYQGLTLNTVKQAMSVVGMVVCVCESQRQLYSPTAPSTVIFVGASDPIPRQTASLLDFTPDEAATVMLRDLSLPSSPFTYLCLGIICPRKNQIWATQVFQKFAKDKQNVRLQIVGARYTCVYEMEYLQKLREVVGDDPRIEMIDVSENVVQFMLTANDEGGEETVAYHEQSALNTAAEDAIDNQPICSSSYATTKRVPDTNYEVTPQRKLPFVSAAILSTTAVLIIIFLSMLQRACEFYYPKTCMALESIGVVRNSPFEVSLSTDALVRRDWNEFLQTSLSFSFTNYHCSNGNNQSEWISLVATTDKPQMIGQNGLDKEARVLSAGQENEPLQPDMGIIESSSTSKSESLFGASTHCYFLETIVFTDPTIVLKSSPTVKEYTFPLRITSSDGKLVLSAGGSTVKFLFVLCVLFLVRWYLLSSSSTPTYRIFRREFSLLILISSLPLLRAYHRLH